MMRVGIGYDAHRLVPNRPLVLGGVMIPFEMGLTGHSDADVIAHAIGDALLGAAALGDLGTHFPDSDLKYQNISSLLLLEKILQLLDKNGYRIANIDVTVVLQQPKVAPFIWEMRQKIARALQIAVDRVAVKAKTTEWMGFTGTSEGISCYAIALIQELRDVN